MQIIKLTKDDIEYLETNYSTLTYNHEKNVIVGVISFNLKYAEVNEEPIIDEYEIEIDLNSVTDSGMPIVRETAGRILGIAINKKLLPGDLHLNNPQGELCMIIPPKIKERYPDGFNLKILLEHIEEHLYWVSYFEKYDKKPWKEYGHTELGYLQLYLEDKHKYASDVKQYFNCKNRQMLKQKIKYLRKKYGV